MQSSRSTFRERLGVYLLGVAIGCVIAGFIFMGKYQARKRQASPQTTPTTAPAR